MITEVVCTPPAMNLVYMGTPVRNHSSSCRYCGVAGCRMDFVIHLPIAAAPGYL